MRLEKSRDTLKNRANDISQGESEDKYFSFKPSVVCLAEQLLWLFQFGSITLYSTSLFHSLEVNAEK